MKRSIFIVVLLLAALTLRVYNLDVPFWCDESYTALTATAESSIASLIAIEHSPPLYYIGVMKPWSYISTEEWWFRLPSVIAGLGFLLFSWKIGYAVGGRPVAVAAVLLNAADAYLVTHSREARSYIFAGFFSFWMFREAIEIIKQEGEARGAWLRFGAASILACYVHYVQVFLVGGAALGILFFKPNRRTILRIFLLAASGAVAFIPWYALLAKQLFEGTFYASVWEGSGFSGWHFKDGLYYIYRLIAWSWFYNLPPQFFSLLYKVGLLFLAGAGGVLISAGSLSRSFRALISMTIITLLSAGILWMFRIVGEPVYIISLFGLMNVLWAAILWRLSERVEKICRPGRWILIIGTALLILLDLQGISEVYQNRFHLEDRLERDPWPEAVEFISANIEPDDAVVVVPGWPSPGGWYFRKMKGLSLYQIWDPTPYFQRAAPYEKMTVGEPDELAALIKPYPRVFTIRFREGHYQREKEFWDHLGGSENIEPLKKYGRLNLGILRNE